MSVYRDCRKDSKTSLLTASLSLGICREKLVKFEYLEEEPHPDLVLKMCNSYSAGVRLASWHCTHNCSIGRICGQNYGEMIPSLAGMKLLSSLGRMQDWKNRLVDILEDGRITPDEFDDLDSILKECNIISNVAMALKIEKEKVTCVGAQMTSRI